MPNLRRRRAPLAGILTAAVLLAGSAAFAPSRGRAAPADAFCSVRPPIKFSAQRTRGIVLDATAVVRVRAIGAAPAPPGARASGYYMAFQVLEVLKGTPASDTLVFMGVPDDRDSFRPEDEDEVPYLSYHRWSAGDCITALYRPGAEYLLLLGRRVNGEPLHPYWQILAPTNEQIRGPDDPWVRWVRTVLESRRTDG